MFIFSYLFKNLIKTITRHLYWLYRLSKCKIGKGVLVDFPLIIEGKGIFTFGDGMKIQHKVNLGAGAGATVSFGKNTMLQEQVYVRIDKDVNFVFGDNCSLGKGTTIYTNAHWQIGNGVVIASNCALHAREPGKNGEFIVGEGSHIGDNTIIDLTDKVEIGRNVAIGPNCTLYTHDHDYKNTANVAAWKGPLIKHPIIIEDGVWVGSNVTILPGVTISKNAVIAAGAVVNRSLEGEAIYGGVPAKLLKRNV